MFYHERHEKARKKTIFTTENTEGTEEQPYSTMKGMKLNLGAPVA